MTTNPDEDELVLMKWLEGENESSKPVTSTAVFINEGKQSTSTARSFKDAFGFLQTDDKGSSSTAEVSKPKVLYSELGSGQHLVVNPCQKGNPVLELIKGIPWKYADATTSLPVDYIMSPHSCCFFLSLRYHALKPDYIYGRIKALRNSQAFSVCILLCLVDIKDSDKFVRELTSLCLVTNFTLLLAFSNNEAATYLETFKSYENKPADMLQRQSSANQGVQTVEVLSSIRKVNSTDAQTLMVNFESIAGIADASEKDLGCCPGIGGLKAKNIHDLFRQPFLKE